MRVNGKRACLPKNIGPANAGSPDPLRRLRRKIFTTSEGECDDSCEHLNQCRSRSFAAASTGSSRDPGIRVMVLLPHTQVRCGICVAE